MNKTCETCKHWDRSFDNPIYELKRYGYEHLKLRKCKNTHPLYQAINYIDDHNEKISDAYINYKAFVKGVEDAYTVLLTKKDFGCVSHEEIENNEKDHTN